MKFINNGAYIFKYVGRKFKLQGIHKRGMVWSQQQATPVCTTGPSLKPPRLHLEHYREYAC